MRIPGLGPIEYGKVPPLVPFTAVGPTPSPCHLNPQYVELAEALDKMLAEQSDALSPWAVRKRPRNAHSAPIIFAGAKVRRPFFNRASRKKCHPAWYRFPPGPFPAIRGHTHDGRFFDRPVSDSASWRCQRPGEVRRRRMRLNRLLWTGPKHGVPLAPTTLSLLGSSRPFVEQDPQNSNYRPRPPAPAVSVVFYLPMTYKLLAQMHAATESSLCRSPSMRSATGHPDRRGHRL